MGLVVEDGTGKATANTYIALADADAYHVERGNNAWAQADDVKKVAALIKATAYIDAVYGLRAPGNILVSTQALVWPRIGAIDRDGYPVVGVPTRLKHALCEAALISLLVDLLPDLERPATVKSERSGGQGVDYSANGLPYKTFQIVDAYMKPVLRAGNRIIRG